MQPAADRQSSHRVDPGPAPRRVPELDALRGLAALAVVGYHVRRDWFPYGWAAVDLFFVLSGYLITSIIVRDGGSPGFLRRFYVRRGLRIWPIYYLTILALIVANSLRLLPVRLNWSGLWPYLTYTQNLPDHWGGRSPVLHPWLRHTWTLAIEEQFYLLWPAALLLFRRRHVAPLALACLAGTVAARLAGVKMTLLLGRLDGLALGALLAALLAERGRSEGVPVSSSPLVGEGRSDGARRARPRRTALAAILALATSAAGLLALHAAGRLGLYAPEPGATLTILLANLGAFGLVALTVHHAGRPALRPLRAAPLVLLGQMSYGLYLYHPLVLGYSAGTLRLARWGDLPPLRLILTLLACLAVAAASWFLIERRILAWKDRLAPERSGPVPAPHYDAQPAPVARPGNDAARATP
jgi:peptidoglycan/LPS O-acetylase OafA/YrhL